MKVNGWKFSKVSVQGEHWTMTPVIRRHYEVLDHQRLHHMKNKEGMQHRAATQRNHKL